MAGPEAGACDRFSGDDVAHRVTWQGTGASALPAGTYDIRIALRHASLYSYAIVPG